MALSPLSRFRRRPLELQFRRGVRAGFVFTAAIAIAVVAVTEYTSHRLERQAEAIELLAAQRVDLAEIRADAAALVLAGGPSHAAELRVELADTSASLVDRHIDLRIARPEFAAATVTVAGETMVTGDATREISVWVGRLADLQSTSPDAVTILGGYLTRVDDLAVAIDAELVAVLGADQSAVYDSADTIRTAGRVIAAVALIGSFFRLVLVGQALVARLGREQQIATMADKQHRSDRARRDLNHRLAEGLESAEDEPDVRVVVERAFATVIGDHPAEMLLADSSKAHLRPTAANPAFDAPGCGVTSPWSCPAVRRGSTIQYDDSSGIRACPYLTGRRGGECASVCVPVSFMGDAMGVLHVTGEVGWSAVPAQIESLELIASQAAMRLGQIRSMAKARLQASTDVLTGLPNRRATEEHIGQLLSLGISGSVAIADLDHFKQLNDTHGHEAGDRALRLFAEVVRESIREDDWAGRWGGEEFVMYLPELSAVEAREVLDRVRVELARRCGASTLPDVTVSIGVVGTEAADELETLVALADECLYAAKENGRDRVVVGPVAAEMLEGSPRPGSEVAS